MAVKNYEDEINKMYDSQLASQKNQLTTDYETADAELAAKQEAAKKQLETNITRTRTDAQKNAMNAAEYYNAAGLSSGARAQARLAQDNQLMADITTLRAAQQQADADTERQRSLLSKEYASAIAQAQAENDLARAQALYAEAKEAEQKLLAKQEAAAGVMAQAGDYTRYGDVYGLSADEVKKLNGLSSAGSGGGGYDNQGYGSETVAKVQKMLGVTADGLWGPVSQAKAMELYSTSNLKELVNMIGSATYDSVRQEMAPVIDAGDMYNAYQVLNKNKQKLSQTDYDKLYNWIVALDANG